MRGRRPGRGAASSSSWAVDHCLKMAAARLALAVFMSSVGIVLPESPCPCSPTSLCTSLSPQPPPGRHEQAIFLAGGGPWYHGDISTVLPWSTANITSVTVFGANSFTKEMCEAHRHGARAITLLPLEPAGGAGINLTDPAYRHQWVNESITHLRHYGGGGWDGANLDVEGFDDATKRDGLTAIVCELRAAMSKWLPGSQLSFDSSMDPIRDNQYYDYKSLSDCVDFFVPMAYDLMGGQPAPNSPLPAVKSGLQNYAKLNVPMSSIVLALPFYGYSVPCAPHGDPKGCVLGSIWSSSAFQKPYGEIIDDLLPNATTGPLWDESASSPFFDYNDHSPRLQAGATRPHPHGYMQFGTSMMTIRTNSKPCAVAWPPCPEGQFGLACNSEDGTETIMCMRVVCIGCCVGSAKRTQRWLAPPAVRSWRSRNRVWPSARRAAIALPHAVPSPLPMLVSGRQLGTTRP
jgi:hypothetical protein